MNDTRGISRSFAAVTVCLALAATFLGGCQGKTEPGPAVAFSEASVELPDRIRPKICEGKANGKRFSIVGYPHWTTGTVAHMDGNGGGVAHIDISEKNDASGQGLGKARVSANVKIKSLFGGGIAKPEFENAKTTSKGIGKNRSNETTGTLSDESMKLYTVDGTPANNTVKLRITLEVEGNDGACNLNFVEARREG